MKKLFTFLYITLASLFAQPTINTQDIEQKYDNFTLYYHEDTQNDLTYEAVQAMEFTQTTDNRFALGFLDNPVWFKITLHNPQSDTQEYILALDEVFYDYVYLYYEQNGQHIEQKSGVQVDLSQRQINNPNAHFALTIGAQEKIDLYIKARPFFATFGQFFLYEKQFYHNHIHKEGFLYTFYLGAVLAIAFYNLFLYFYLKARVYLYYFGYSLSFGLWAGGFFGGMAFYYIPIEYNYNLHIVTPLAILFLMLFSNEVLEVRKNHPRIYKFLQLHHYLLIFSALLIFFYDKLQISFKIGFEFTNIVAGYIFFFYIYFALKQINSHSKIAKLYLIAIGAFLISITVLSLMTMGVLPNNIFTRYGFIVGSLLEIVLLSLLLAYRIDMLQKNYQKTLQSEIERQTKNLHQKNLTLTRIVSEKEELLKEMFHRVKNNFQILISMLYLEIGNERSKEITNKIENVIKKLHSMSIVHDLLYGKSSHYNLEAKSYFQKLTTHLVMKDAKIKLHIQPLFLPASTVKNLGLIVNELFVNTVKYTPSQHKLHITITLTQQDNRIFFSYLDNSNGYSDVKNGYGTEFIKETLQKLKNVKMDIDTDKKIRYDVAFDRS
ncbi:MAG: 7TM diverse intracellular signaling domain-containing protein [Campylobacterota bacterium]